MPSGRQLEAGDGDTIVVDGDDRVSVVRRRQARVRVVADDTARTVLVIADWGTRRSAQPDGHVNRTWRFAGVDGRWPLDSRWEGDSVLTVPEMPPMGPGPILSFETPAGVVAFVGGPPRAQGLDAAVVLRYESASGGGRDGVTFDQAERDALSPDFMTSFSTMSFGSSGGGYVAGGSTGTTVSRESPGSVARRAAPSGPGPILRAMPRILERVTPEWPPAARDAGVVGIVILQADVALDGSVRDVRVVRGVPMLNDAAIEAVRHWRFEPAGSDGRLDPVTVTVTVQFPPQPK
jgi:TonB family protein